LNKPEINTAVKKISKAPKSVIAVNIIAVKPAAGPETLCEIYSNTLPIPPIIPEIIPENARSHRNS
jgi:hypothetical protein